MKNWRSAPKANYLLKDLLNLDKDVIDMDIGGNKKKNNSKNKTSGNTKSKKNNN